MLFVSSVFPDTQNNGLAMRAGMFLEALAQRYRVTLLVVPVYNSRTPSSAALLERLCEEELVVAVQETASLFTRLKKTRSEQPSTMRLFARHMQAAREAVGERAFDAIHAFRIYTAPLAMAIAERAGRKCPKLHLDLDDIGSTTHERLARVSRLNRRLDEEARELREAAANARVERELLPRFDRVYVCSVDDAAAIAPLARCAVEVVPNAVRPPEKPPERLTTHPFTFLFIGNLNYLPNEDAVRFFCNEVVPLIRRKATAPFLVRIAGAGMSPGLIELARAKEVRLAGEVADVGFEYGEADAVVVPIRGGGGTRIKVLEAFAYGRPVISTTIGIEGIDVISERDYLQADDPYSFAGQCLRLMDDAALRESLAENAARLVAERYTQARVNEVIAGLP